MKTAEQILEQQVNAQNYPITDYIGKDGYVWKMILKAMEEYAAQQANGVEASDETALPIQNVSVSFLSEGMANKIYKQIGLLAEKQGGITGITILNQLPSWLQNFMKELAADYGRQIDFLKSVLANER